MGSQAFSPLTKRKEIGNLARDEPLHLTRKADTMNTALVMFAIEAGVKLGKKIYEVLVDKTIEKPLLLPVGELHAKIDETRAVRFFDENPELIAAKTGDEPTGPYHGFSRPKLVLAYKSLLSIDERLSSSGEAISGDLREAVLIVNQLHKFEQYKKGFGSKSGAQRILGTLVEIGIDYFATHPEAMGRDSNGRKIARAFLSRLEDADFAEGERGEILGSLFGGALRTLEASAALIEDNERAQAMLGGMTAALMADVKAAGTHTAYLDRKDLFERIGSSLLRGAAGALTENIALFIRKEGTTKTLVQSTLEQVLEGIRGKENLFTNESLELIYKSALSAVGENPELFSDNNAVQDLIQSTVEALSEGEKVFSPETFRAVVSAALDVVRDNAEMLIDPDEPSEQLLADAVSAVAGSLSSTLAGGGTAVNLLSRTQLVELARIVFEEVAAHPEHLLGEDAADVEETALAQTIGSVTRALGKEPGLLVTGDGFVRLLRGTLEVAVLNADKLIDFGGPATSDNLLFKVLKQIVDVIKDEANDPRGLVTRDVFLEIAERALPLVSANLEPLLGNEPDLVGDTVTKVLGLASGPLEDRTNGANLPLLTEELLRRALWGELNLDEETAVVNAAKDALRTAS